MQRVYERGREAKRASCEGETPVRVDWRQIGRMVGAWGGTRGGRWGRACVDEVRCRVLRVSRGVYFEMTGLWRVCRRVRAVCVVFCGICL